MKIQLKLNAISGKVQIPRGEYTVALNTDTQTISLVGGTKSYSIPAIKRRSVCKSKSLQISFYASGGSLWSLAVNAPREGEWIATLELKDSSD
jgi:hypothetical protein